MTPAKLWSLIALPLMLLSTAVLGLVSGVVAVFGMRTAPVQIAIARLWGRSILFLGGVKVEVEGREYCMPEAPTSLPQII